MIAALTQSRSILMKADRRVEEEREEIFGRGISDFLILIRAFAWAERHDFRVDGCRPLAIHADSARQVKKLFHQFLDIAKAEGLDVDGPPPRDEGIARTVLAGFADHVARRRSGGTLQCDIVHGRRGMLARQSVAQDSRLVVAAEIIEVEGRGGDAQVVLSLVTQIEEAWLREMFPADFRNRVTPLFDNTQNRVVFRTERVFRDLVLDSQDRDAEPGPDAQAVLAERVRDGDLRLTQWTDDVDQWIARVNFAARVAPESGVESFGDDVRERIIAAVCREATSYRDIKDAPVLSVAKGLVPASVHAQVERLAPERVPLPGGKRAKVDYSSDPPVVRARIQELYGVESVLRVGGGKVPVTIEVLAPNMRPVQVTRDLATFWREGYPALRNQLQRQYPKHEWR